MQKIGALIKRLQAPESDIVQAVIMPGERLEAIVENSRRARGAAVELALDARSAGVAMTPASFDAVVLHLLDNAIEATKSGGQDPTAPVRISLRHEARRAVVDIADRGPGMAPEFVREELFQPFRTSKPEGSGIGAYQARELVREVGGDLLVISRPGSGTTMRVLLPAVEGAGPEEVPSTSS